MFRSIKLSPKQPRELGYRKHNWLVFFIFMDGTHLLAEWASETTILACCYEFEFELIYYHAIQQIQVSLGFGLKKVHVLLHCRIVGDEYSRQGI
jgi:hypothetical protein